MKPIYLLIFFLPLFFSCASGPVYVPLDMPPAKIIQRAQEAADINRYKTALQYYEVLLERHGHNGEHLAVAEYEIAFIHYKQKKFASARQGFETLLLRYHDEGHGMPPQFRVLSEMMLKRMSDRGH